MNLIEKKTGKKVSAEIELINKKDLAALKKNKNFGFDWSLENNSQTFKLKITESDEIIGLISLVDYPEEFRIHINLIEASKIYRGKNKKILNIPGCLIAFACKLSFKKGYEGFVSLIPKTQLIKYYMQNYGFLQFGRQLAILEEISESLIQKFIGDEEI